MTERRWLPGRDPGIIHEGFRGPELTQSGEGQLRAPRPCYLIPEPVTWPEWCRRCGLPVYRRTNSPWVKCAHIPTGIEPCSPDDPYLVALPIWHPVRPRHQQPQPLACIEIRLAPGIRRHRQARSGAEASC